MRYQQVGFPLLVISLQKVTIPGILSYNPEGVLLSDIFSFHGLQMDVRIFLPICQNRSNPGFHDSLFGTITPPDRMGSCDHFPSGILACHALRLFNQKAWSGHTWVRTEGFLCLVEKCPKLLRSAFSLLVSRCFRATDHIRHNFPHF